MTDRGDTGDMGTQAENRSRVQRISGWLRRRSEHKLARLGWQWFKGYMAASRNSACAISIYACLSVVPAALVFIAVVYKSGGTTNAFPLHPVDHLRPASEPASAPAHTVGNACPDLLAAT